MSLRVIFEHLVLINNAYGGVVHQIGWDPLFNVVSVAFNTTDRVRYFKAYRFLMAVYSKTQLPFSNGRHHTQAWKPLPMIFFVPPKLNAYLPDYLEARKLMEPMESWPSNEPPLEVLIARIKEVL
jgi:hypothetical protein